MAEDKDKQKQLPNLSAMELIRQFLSTGTATNIPYRCNISAVISILAKMMENCLSIAPGRTRIAAWAIGSGKRELAGVLHLIDVRLVFRYVNG